MASWQLEPIRWSGNPLPNLRHQWSLASQLWWWRGGPKVGARRALGGLKVQHGEPGQPEDGGESGEGLDDGEGEKAGGWQAKAAQGLLLLLVSRVGKSIYLDPKVLVSRPLQLPSVSRRREGREGREKGAGNDTREEGRGGNVEKGKERGKSKTEKGETETRRGRLGKGPNEGRMNYEMRKGSSNNERGRAGSQGKETFAKGSTRGGGERRSVGEKEPKEAEKEVVQELQENGTKDGSVNREEKEAMSRKRETRRKSPAVTSISEDAKPWGRRQNSPASSPLVPSSSLQSLPNPSRGGLSLAGSFTLPRRTNKSGSEPPVIRPFLSHHLTPSSTSKRALSSTLSAPQPRTSAFCPSCPPRTYASLPRAFNSLPRRSNKASYTFYSHSISTTISASPTASSTNLFIPRKVPFLYLSNICCLSSSPCFPYCDPDPSP